MAKTMPELAGKAWPESESCWKKLIRAHVIKHNNDWIVSNVETFWCKERDYDKNAKQKTQQSALAGKAWPESEFCGNKR